MYLILSCRVNVSICLFGLKYCTLDLFFIVASTIFFKTYIFWSYRNFIETEIKYYKMKKNVILY